MPNSNHPAAKKTKDFFKNIIPDMLSEQKISFKLCDVLEETLQRLAGIKEVSTSASTTASDDFMKIAITLVGITKENADLFLNFLNQYDLTSQCKTLTNEKDGSVSYQFLIDSEIMCDQIAPLFIAEINRIVADEPEKLAKYQTLSQNAFRDAPLKATPDDMPFFVKKMYHMFYPEFFPEQVIEKEITKDEEESIKALEIGEKEKEIVLNQYAELKAAYNALPTIENQPKTLFSVKDPVASAHAESEAQLATQKRMG